MYSKYNKLNAFILIFLCFYANRYENGCKRSGMKFFFINKQKLQVQTFFHYPVKGWEIYAASKRNRKFKDTQVEMRVWYR